MDADLSHRPIVARDLWSARHQGEIVIASRYTGGGSASMPFGRRLLSEVLNLVFSRVLGLSARDTSSGYRLYDARVLQPERLQGRDFDVLQEILVRAAVAGWRVREIPFGYEARRYGRSHARVLRLGMAYARTLWYLHRLRRATDTGRVPDGKPASTYWRDVSR
jgi:dolichol-phosphate mannosyltransferase